MDRLTKRNAFGAALPNSYEPTDKEEFENWMRKYLKLFAEKLAKYEDAEQEGLLVRLPCKVYSFLYEVTDKKVKERRVDSIEVLRKGFHLRLGRNLANSNTNIGKTLFLTKEEAEHALKERKIWTSASNPFH